MPPCPGPFSALADKAPPTMTLPSGPPSSTIRPFLPRSERASMAPWVFTTVLSSALAVLAAIRTRPPSALSRPPLLASALATPASTRMSSSLLPSKFSVRSLPAPSPTPPICARTVPRLSTCAPSRAMLPPSAAVMAPPWLRTPLVEGPVKRYLEELPLNSASVMSSVEATRPPTLTWAPRPKSTPLGLTRKTWPLASIRPWISLALVPITRFRAIELLLGWLKITRSPAATLKESQLAMSLSTFWLTDRLLPPDRCISPFALPPTTVPPLGSA